MEHPTENHVPHILSDRLLTAVWAALIVLTGVTVGASHIDLGFLNILVAMSIATVKTSLVVFIFMHLKYENWLIKLFVVLACVVLAIFIGMTFFDVAFRETVRS